MAYMRMQLNDTNARVKRRPTKKHSQVTLLKKKLFILTRHKLQLLISIA